MNKKLFLGMFAAAGMLLATSCSNDELDAVQSGNEAQVTFSLATEGGIATRAISDGTGANKLVYAVYKLDEKGENPVLQKVVGSNEDGQFVKTDFKSGDNVSVTLAKGQTYQVAFWAQDGDCKAYDTDDLTAVEVKYKNEDGTDAVNNDERRDAFFKMVEFEVAGNKTIDVVLKRPFAQINVGVDAEDWEAAVASGIEIETSAVVVKNAANTINLLTGAVTGNETVTYASDVIPDETLYVETDATKDGKEAYNWLSMSYILVADANETDEDNDGTVGDARTTLESLQFTFYPKNGKPIEFKEGLNSVPVQRNWRTNILGKILTGDIQFNITIDPVYDGDIIYPSEQEQELEMAATFGGTVTLTEDVLLTTPLNVGADMILNIADDKTLTGSINVAEGASLTVNGGAINNTDNAVSGIISNGDLTLNNVEITSARHALRIESGNVVINGGTYTVNPTTKMTANALNVGDDNKTANVTIKGGTFTGPKGNPTADSGAAVTVKAGSTVTIEGGDFSKGKNNTLSSKGTLTVKGGTFDQDPSAYVADGYKVVETEFNGTKYHSVVPEGNTYENPIVSAEQLKALGNTAVSGTYNLLADIDMTGIDMQPIMLASGGNNSLVFNGNGHTIKNLKLVQAYQNGMNVAGLFNVLYSGKEITINDLTIVDATSTSDKYAGVVLAYNSTTTAINLNNVNVDDATITAETVSPFVGYTTGPVNLTNCDVNNISMTGEKLEKIGAFVGTANQASCIVTVNNCTNNTEYKAAGRVINGATMKIDGAVAVVDADALKKAIIDGGNIVLASDITVDTWNMYSETLSIGSGEIIAIKMDGLTIDGNNHTLTINNIKSAGNGNNLFHSATNLNISNLTIKYADGLAGGIGLKSGVISNVKFNGGVYSILPGTGTVKVEDCTFASNGTSIYFEEARDNLTVTGCTFNNAADANIILLRGAVQFTNNTVNSGRTVNVVSGAPVVTGNDFTDVRLKVYKAATATISNNTINNLEFEADTYASTFANNNLSDAARELLNSKTKSN